MRPKGPATRLVGELRVIVRLAAPQHISAARRPAFIGRNGKGNGSVLVRV